MVLGIEVGKAFVSTCSVVMLEKLKDWLGAQRRSSLAPVVEYLLCRLHRGYHRVILNEE